MAWLWSLAVIIAVYFALSLFLESRKKFAPARIASLNEHVAFAIIAS